MKYLLPTFSNLPAIDLGRHAKGLLVRLHTITGWKLPDDDFFLNTLVSEFTKYLTENCGDLNPEEIGYAFRNYGLETKDWGKSMNLQLIHDPISEYRKVRADISAMEERLKESKNKPDKQIEHTGEVDWSPEWNKLLESARNGSLNALYCVAPIYDWLKKQGMIAFSDRERNEIFEECRQAYAYEIMVALRTANAPDMRAKYELLIKDGREWRENSDLFVHVILMSKQETLKRQAYLTIKNEAK